MDLSLSYGIGDGESSMAFPSTRYVYFQASQVIDRLRAWKGGLVMLGHDQKITPIDPFEDILGLIQSPHLNIRFQGRRSYPKVTLETFEMLRMFSEGKISQPKKNNSGLDINHLFKGLKNELGPRQFHPTPKLSLGLDEIHTYTQDRKDKPYLGGELPEDFLPTAEEIEKETAIVNSHPLFGRWIHTAESINYAVY